MTIGEKIRALRIERGMSQNDLALACGYTSRASINKIELGKVDPPQSKIQAIADALDVSPVSLLVEDLESVGHPPLSSDEEHIITIYRTLSPEGRQQFLVQLNLVANMYSSEKNQSVSTSDVL